MSKFINMTNEKVIWSNVSNLFVRKQDLVNQVEGTLIYPEEGTIDISKLNDLEITQLDYEKLENFISKYSSQKYINDETLGLCPIICVFKKEENLEKNILEQTDKMLIAYNNSMYLACGVHYDKDESSGALGTYKIIQTPYLEAISNEFIESLSIK